jgi:hypothetical protein
VWWGKEKPPKIGAEVKFYKDFPTIAIPQCLCGKDWSDESWGNDVTARSQMALDDHHTIEVWVFPFLKAEREPGYKDHRYIVTTYNDAGDEFGQPIECDNEMAITLAVEVKKRNFKSIASRIHLVEKGWSS